MPRRVLRSALGSLGSALAVQKSAYVLLGCAHVPVRNFDMCRRSDVPPDDFGCSEGWSRAHCAFACLINASLCSQSFCAAFALSAADNESWW
jgi:hypothetical protein